METEYKQLDSGIWVPEHLAELEKNVKETLWSNIRKLFK